MTNYNELSIDDLYLILHYQYYPNFDDIREAYNVLFNEGLRIYTKYRNYKDDITDEIISDIRKFILLILCIDIRPAFPSVLFKYSELNSRFNLYTNDCLDIQIHHYKEILEEYFIFDYTIYTEATNDVFIYYDASIRSRMNRNDEHITDTAKINGFID